MPSEEFASTIDELARKLDDVPAEKIREELQRYLDHGVPLHQAKKDLEQALGAGTRSSPSTTSVGEAEDKNVEAVTPTDGNVNLTVKILTVNEREITARGEQKTIWSGMMGDATGQVPYTSWRDVGLEEGAVVRIENGYITEWQDEAQVNIGDHATVEATDENIEVPPAADQATEHDVHDLEDGMGSVTVEARMLSKDAREVTVRGEETTLWEGQLADETGRIPYTAWHDHGFEKGDVLRIENGYVRTFRGTPQLNFGENARVTELDDDAVPSGRELSNVPGPTLSTTEKTVGELAPGDGSVDVTGRVLDVNERSITTDGNDRTLWEGEIADATGRIPYTAWEDPGFEKGDVVRVENAYVRTFRGLPQLNWGETAKLTPQSDDDAPPHEELAKPREATLEGIIDAEGAVGIRVEGVMLEIRDGSGLILRCPECRRVLQDHACHVHGPVEGVTDLRIKAVLDDGSGAVMLILDRSMTERILETTLEACQERAQAEGSRDVVLEDVKDTLLLKRVRVDGNATHDDYGTTLVPKDVVVLEPEDAEDAAEGMISRVDALIQEVSA